MDLGRWIGIAAAGAAALMLGGCAHNHATVAAPTAPATAASTTVSSAAPVPTAASATTTATPAAAKPDPDLAKLPDGTGKELVATLCTQCHTLTRVVEEHETRAMWQDTLSSMQDNGLEATPEQLAAVLDYLAKNFPPGKQ